MTDPMGWHAANNLARSYGGYLATIRNRAENDWLFATFLESLPPDTRLWIGFTDDGEEGTWSWVSTEPVTFTNWAPTQPDNAGGNQNHGTLWDSGMWDDDQGGNPRGAILEIPGPFLPEYLPVGNGCPGSAGTPSLSACPGSTPSIGTTFCITLGNVPPLCAFCSPVLFLGAPLAAPIDLTLVQAPGCVLYTSIVLIGYFPPTRPTAVWSIVIPNNPSLLGGLLRTQAALPDSLANPLGITLSNAADMIIGIK